MIQVNKRLRIHPKFETFRKQGLFIDCVIRTGSCEIKCHKLVLARFSPYFQKLFLERNETEFDVDFDPGNALSSIIDFLYSTIVDVDEENIGYLAAVANYYGFGDLELLLADVLPMKITFENSLSLMEVFAKYNLNVMIDAVVPMLASNFEQYDLKQLLASTNASALAKIMLHENFPRDVDVDAKLSMIDTMCETASVLSDEDKVMIGKAVDLESNGSYQWMLDHKCDWLPLDVQKRFLNEILEKRRKIVREMEQDHTLLTAAKVSRWYELQWLTSVANAADLKEIDVMLFIGTFGGLTSFVNPVQFGFMDLDMSKPINKYFSGHFIFEKGGHFAAMKLGDVCPWIEFNLGRDSKFVLRALSFDMPLLEASAERPSSERPRPGKIEVVTRGETENRFYYENTACKMTCNCDPSNQLSLTMVEENAVEGWIFRFAFVHAFGCFVG